MSNENDPGPDDSGANVVLLLAWIAIIATPFVIGWPFGIATAAVCLTVMGVGLKITAAVRHTASRVTGGAGSV